MTSTRFLKPSMDDDIFGSNWKEDKADLVLKILLFNNVFFIFGKWLLNVDENYLFLLEGFI